MNEHLSLRKFTLLFAFFLFALSSANGQNQSIKVNFKNASLKEVFSVIERQTTYRFSYRISFIDGRKDITFSKSDATVKEILDVALRKRNLEYEIVSPKMIVISDKQKGNVAKPTTRKIIGIVKDEKGDAIIGASVSIRGTNSGTITDINGSFSINASDNGVLQVSYIGYSSVSLPIHNKQNFSIVMREDAKQLDEVVVVGYGIQRKVDVTGAVGMITSDALKSRPVQNVSQALQGLIPGLNLNVGNSGGALNGSLSIDIRGTGTIGSGSTASPLILIDGVEGNINTLNPYDIESVSVLKDAASSSIYGARAAFGVILVTTKSGKAGKTRISYNGNIGFSSAVSLPKKLDSYRFAEYVNAAAANAGVAAIVKDDVLEKIKDFMDGTLLTATSADANGYWQNNNLANGNTDWFKEVYGGSAPETGHNLSVTTGNENLSLYLSGGYINKKGLVNFGEDRFKRYNFIGKVSAKLSNWAKVTYTSKFIREDFRMPTYMTGLFFHNIAREWPTKPVYDPNGYLFRSNAIQLQNGGKTNSQNDYNIQQIQLVLEPIKDWHIYLEGNMETTVDHQHYDVLPVYTYKVDGTPEAIIWDTGVGNYPAGTSRVNENYIKYNYYSTNIYSDYSKTLKSGLSYKILLGFNAELNKNNGISAQKDGLISPNVPTINTSTTNPVATGSYDQYAVAGFFGRLNLNYKDRYLFEANGRYDGSSRFIRGKRWGFFPSFSAGWNLAHENFMENISKTIDMNSFKFRISWGQLGNTNTTSLYPFYQTMPISSNYAWLVNGSLINSSSNPSIVSSSLTWETIENWDAGLDFGFFRNRLTGSFDIFVRKTKDMVGPAPELSSTLGTTVPKINNCDMQSKGFELELGWRDRLKDFSYGVKFVLSDSRQKILKYPNVTKTISNWYDGKMFGEIWGFETIGIANSQEEMDAHLTTTNQSALGTKWTAGDIMYKDLNGNGKIDWGDNTLANPGDRKVIGNSIPRYNFGITLDASYKGFDARVFIQGVAKRDYWINGTYFWGSTGFNEWLTAGLEEHWNFWRAEDDPLGANLNAYYPRPHRTSSQNTYMQSRYLQNAAYVRLKNFQIGYTLPQTITSKWGISLLRLYISGDNMLTHTKLAKMFDPETLGCAYTDGVSGKLYPLQKTISFGLNVNF
jgi:TonB-linked SusC/RagA family outer membrane protein